MIDFIEITIGDIGEVITGNTPPTTNRALYGGPYPFIKPTDMEKDSRYVRIWEETYSEMAFKRYEKAFIPKGATGVVTIGTIGEKLFQADRPCFTNQSVNVVVPSKKYDPDFVYYLLKYNLFKVKNANPGTASGRDHVSKSNFCSIKVLAPKDKKDQEQIASILSAYDDLIEVNNKRITLLEQMAEQIYKEWFVRMRFPGYQDVEFEKGVPKGWEETYFKDFIKLNRGFDLPDEKIVLGDYPVIASTTIKAFHYQYKVEAPCVTTGRSGSLGKVQFVNRKSWPLNTCLYVKDFKRNSPRFIFYFLRSIKLENFNSGAGVPTLNQNHLHTLKFHLPPIPIQKEFDKVVIPIFDQIENLESQIDILKQTRDLLLPRLISGKLRVKDIPEPQNVSE